MRIKKFHKHVYQERFFSTMYKSKYNFTANPQSLGFYCTICGKQKPSKESDIQLEKKSETKKELLLLLARYVINMAGFMCIWLASGWNYAGWHNGSISTWLLAGTTVLGIIGFLLMKIDL